MAQIRYFLRFTVRKQRNILNPTDQLEAVPAHALLFLMSLAHGVKMKNVPTEI